MLAGQQAVFSHGHLQCRVGKALNDMQVPSQKTINKTKLFFLLSVFVSYKMSLSEACHVATARTFLLKQSIWTDRIITLLSFQVLFLAVADCEIEAQRAFLVKTTIFFLLFGDLLIKTDMYIPKEYILKKQIPILMEKQQQQRVSDFSKV